MAKSKPKDPTEEDLLTGCLTEQGAEYLGDLTGKGLAKNCSVVFFGTIIKIIDSINNEVVFERNIFSYLPK